MAKLIEAIRDYGPRLKLNSTVPLEVLAIWIASRTMLNKSVVLMVLMELKEAVLYFNGMGSPIRLPGLGRFAPSISYDGRLRINLSIDSELSHGINKRDAFSGHINNRANIGLDKANLKARWDEAHPDNPLEL
jgi:hypothetical protein